MKIKPVLSSKYKKTNNMSHRINISMEFGSSQKKFFIQILTMIEPKLFKQQSDA
jgi:hypothetical protein